MTIDKKFLEDCLNLFTIDYDYDDQIDNSNGHQYNNNNNDRFLTHGYSLLQHSSFTLPSPTNLHTFQVFDLEAARSGRKVLDLKLDKTWLMKYMNEEPQLVQDNGPLSTAAIRCHLSALEIGDWKKDREVNGDLFVKINFKKQRLTYETLKGPEKSSLKIKIEFNWSDIAYMNCMDNPLSLEIQLNRSPLFFKEGKYVPRKHTSWESTHDFTENAASSLCIHKLTFKKENDVKQIMRADPKSNRNNQPYKDQFCQVMNNVLPTKEHRREDPQGSQLIILGGGNPNSNISSNSYFSGERGSFPENEHLPNQNGVLCQIFDPVEFPRLNHDESNFVCNKSNFATSFPDCFTDTSQGVMYNHQPQDCYPIADAHQAPSGYVHASPSYTVGHPQINGYRGAVQYHQPTDHCNLLPQHINSYEGGAVQHQQSTNNYFCHQQQINGYEGGAVQYQQSTNHSFCHQQQINGYEGGAAQHQQSINNSFCQQQINSYEGGAVQHQQSTNNSFCQQQQINGYEGALHHQPTAMNQFDADKHQGYEHMG